jgi:hypothetical protein
MNKSSCLNNDILDIEQSQLDYDQGNKSYFSMHSETRPLKTHQEERRVIQIRSNNQTSNKTILIY